MKFLVLTLISNGPDPVTGRSPTPNARLHRVVENAVLGHEVIHLHLDGDGLSPRRQRELLETFQSEVAPALRAAVPSRPLAGAVPRDPDDARPADSPVGVAS
jgi:hypothetical protein